MTVDDILGIAREVGFRDLDNIRDLVRPSIGLIPNRGKPVGSPVDSKLGGLPALPGSASWPTCNNRSMAFIGQVSLESQPKSMISQGLPSQGRLLFFYDADQSTWGFDPKDSGSFSVLYCPEDDDVSVSASWPQDLPDEARYAECPLTSEETVTLPPWENVLIEDLGLDEDQFTAYQDILERVSGDDRWASRALLAGYPDQIQADMMLECAMVSAGLYCGDGSAYQDPRMPDFRRRAREWRHLLQVPSAEETGMMWGDAGCLYYWINEDDMRCHRFDRSWMILQCF